MKVFNKAKWIWANDSLNVDDYASFEAVFEAKTSNVVLNISCDSIYAIYLNNKLVKFMGCSDYPYFKFYDEVKLDTDVCTNTLRIDVWHLGSKSQTYYIAEHGLIFEVIEDGKTICCSNTATKSRVMNEFVNGYKKTITNQLGFSFKYDSNVSKNAYAQSAEIDKSYDSFAKRNINNIDLLDRPQIQISKLEKSYIIDLGKETVGLPDLEFNSNKVQNLLISFGEHIKDGHVRRIIQNRDFSFEYVARKGINIFLNPLRRIAGRYLEVFFEDEIDIKFIGIRPVKYNHQIIEKKINDPLLDKIFKTCVYTLECCMHEHYEDCPWREQALYTLDSRNQMLCGYYAFKGSEFQRHNLLLIGHDEAKNGLLNLCYPMNGGGLTIPMFSLCYIIELFEYVKYTSDKSILREVKDTVYKIVNIFKNRIDSKNLLPYFPRPAWNFYEWTKGSANEDVFDATTPDSKDQYDLIINAMYCYVIPMFNDLFNENIEINEVKDAIKKNLYDEQEHLFRMNTKTSEFSEFGNALALLIGLGDEVTVNKVKEAKNMVRASLSTRGFVYDALLAYDKNNSKFIIDDIKRRYKAMLDEGATTVFETELGSEDFAGAGSMCHGWSALPIYYLNILGLKPK